MNAVRDMAPQDWGAFSAIFVQWVREAETPEEQLRRSEIVRDLIKSYGFPPLREGPYR